MIQCQFFRPAITRGFDRFNSFRLSLQRHFFKKWHYSHKNLSSVPRHTREIGCLEQLSHLVLRQPRRLTGEMHFQTALTVFGLI